jgi:L-cysteine desulfidase
MNLAIGTMVGNLAGMICDGAKIGCAMKTMTGVDAAFRAASLAMLGMGVPVTDGIVGADADASLVNLGRLAQHGMAAVDTEILAIMQSKLREPVVD